MRTRFVILPIVALLLFASRPLDGQDIKVVKLNSLEKIMNANAAEIQVINFWATWCAPCIKELPMFEALTKKQGGETKVTLISLDFADQLGKVREFVKRRNLTSEILLLDEIDYNAWIDKVDPSWSGAIPATLVINPVNGKRKFVEKELKEGELEAIIASVK